MSDAKATTVPLFKAATDRISCYQITRESTIPDSRIHDIINFVVKHTPSSFNVQSARAVVLLKDEHEALWDLADSVAQSTIPEARDKMLGKMVQGFRSGYGTVLFFEDKVDLDALAAKNPLFGHLAPDWGHTSNGMHQYLAWMALQQEGLGCNLQHFNFMPEFTAQVRQKWDVPESWDLVSQLVFGKPEGELVRKRERTYKPLEERVRVFGGSE